MREAIVCRLKMTVWLALFFAPVLVAVWGRHFDQALAENTFLPAPQIHDAIVLTNPASGEYSIASVDPSED